MVVVASTTKTGAMPKLKVAARMRSPLLLRIMTLVAAEFFETKPSKLSLNVDEGGGNQTTKIDEGC